MKKVKLIVFRALCISLVLFLVLSLELVFRLLGYKPRGSYIKQVEHLEVYNNFYVDDDGIYKASRDFKWDSDIAINEDGFRSVPFSAHANSNNSSIMIVSDSFGWGHTAKPISCSFPDILQTEYGFHVHNLSIPGTGLEQYALVACKYVPLLRPSVCCVFVYLGNDINLSMSPTHLRYRPIIEKQWYVANAGIFSAYDEKTQTILPPQEAYRRTLTPSLRLVNLLRETAFGTQMVNWIYNVTYRSKVRDLSARRLINGELLETLQVISEVCASNNCDMLVFPIPVNPIMENTRNSMRDNERLFAGFNYHVIPNLNERDYADFPDDHFNNKGHMKMAQFVAATINNEKTRRKKILQTSD